MMAEWSSGSPEEPAVHHHEYRDQDKSEQEDLVMVPIWTGLAQPSIKEPEPNNCDQQGDQDQNHADPG